MRTERDLLVETIDSETYQRELSNYPHSLFITRQWVESMANESSKPLFLRIYHNKKVIALIAGLMIKGSALQGRQLYFYSAPAINANDVAAHHHSLMALKQYARQNAFARINIRPWDQQHSFAADTCGFISTQTHEFPILFNQGNEIDKISSRIMRNIKKAQKTNVVIQQCRSMTTLDTLMSLLTQTQERRESRFGVDYTPFYLYNLNRDSIEKLLNSGAGIIYCASIDKKVFSVELNLEYNNRAYNVLKASIDEAYQNGVSSLLDYHMIQHYQNNGYSYFNLGGELMSGEGAGLAQFKEGLGGIKHLRRGYYTYYLTFPRNLMNPLMQLGRILPENDAINWAKHHVSKVLSTASK